MMTRDNVRSMEVDSISHQSFPDYLDFQPKALDEVLPTYIY
jgi:NADH dehydrogenase